MIRGGGSTKRLTSRYVYQGTIGVTATTFITESKGYDYLIFNWISSGYRSQLYIGTVKQINALIEYGTHNADPSNTETRLHMVLAIGQGGNSAPCAYIFVTNGVIEITGQSSDSTAQDVYFEVIKKL